MMRIRLLGVAVGMLSAIAFFTPTSHLTASFISLQKNSPHQRAGSVNAWRSPFLWAQVFGADVRFIQSVSAQPLPLRRINPLELSEQVYQQLPDLPRENHYVSSETGQIAIENTLASRVIRYHIYIQERPTNFRLDWKLTLADYLGAFERISPDNYPDYGLQENPMAADIAVIEGLTPGMRDRLVNTLYETVTNQP